MNIEKQSFYNTTCTLNLAKSNILPPLKQKRSIPDKPATKVINLRQFCAHSSFAPSAKIKLKIHICALIAPNFSVKTASKTGSLPKNPSALTVPAPFDSRLSSIAPS